jgi:hypothetical protein
MSKKKKNGKPKNENFSKELDELRSLAISLTNDTKLKVIYDEKSPTSWYHYGKNTICLSLNIYPDFVTKNIRIARKVLDGDLGHEVGHYKLGKHIIKYVEKWIEFLKMRKRDFPKLAFEIVNVMEDRRDNYWVENRWRFDIGKRLTFTNLILKDQIENNLEKAVNDAITKFGLEKIPKTGLMWTIFTNEGLYDADCSFLWEKLTKEETEDLKECIRLMEESKYSRLRIDVVNNFKKVYKIFKKHARQDFKSRRFSIPKMVQFVPAQQGGELKGDISDALKAKLKEMIDKEIKAEEQKLQEDLKKGHMAGEGTGDEIPAPEPDFDNYARLVVENNPEIDKLLKKLKTFMRPNMRRSIYQKRGKIMPSLTARSYVTSKRRRVTNVYIKNAVKYEKEKINIAFLIDFSGSVDRTTAQNILTILTEVFGRFVEDFGFEIGVFGDNFQRIKTFFEMFDNTKARIGNVTVNSWGTRIHDILEAFLKTFNSIKQDRRKILVIASDFAFCDEEEARKCIQQYIKAGIEVKFIGFSGVDDFFNEFGNNVQRATITDATELPDKFLEVYLESQR